MRDIHIYIIFTGIWIPIKYVSLTFLYHGKFHWKILDI